MTEARHGGLVAVSSVAPGGAKCLTRQGFVPRLISCRAPSQSRSFDFNHIDNVCWTLSPPSRSQHRPSPESRPAALWALLLLFAASPYYGGSPDPSAGSIEWPASDTRPLSVRPGPEPLWTRLFDREGESPCVAMPSKLDGAWPDGIGYPAQPHLVYGMQFGATRVPRSVLVRQVRQGKRTRKSLPSRECFGLF